MSYPRMLMFAQHRAGKMFFFAIIALFLWHGMHRIFHNLHDFGVRTGTGTKLVCYGLALLAPRFRHCAACDSGSEPNVHWPRRVLRRATRRPRPRIPVVQGPAANH